jgi:deoxyadenosine/deoxycytidine kinase
MLHHRAESMVMAMRKAEHAQSAGIVFDRHIIENTNVFFPVTSASMAEAERTRYVAAVRKLMEKNADTWGLDAIIYVATPPETALEQIRQRGRAGEENIKLEYLAALHAQYRSYLANLVENPATQIPILTLNAQLSPERKGQLAAQFVTELAKSKGLSSKVLADQKPPLARKLRSNRR